MSDLPRETEARVLAFLDDELSPAEREEVLKMIDSDPSVAEYVRLQRQIDNSVRRLFRPPAIDPVFLQRIASRYQAASGDTVAVAAARPARRQLYAAMLATAASIALAVLGIRSVFTGDEVTIAYRERPLVEVYQQCVEEGFEPYWVCDDPALFAATFERRQGVRLALTELADDQRMLGLAYLAGISRESTSLLATVAGEQTIVFIDKIDRDWHPSTGEFEEAELHVSRWERFGLVFYQVAPPGTPLLTEAFDIVTDGANPGGGTTSVEDDAK